VIDLPHAAYAKLSVEPSVTSVLGTSETWPVWLFRYQARVAMEGTGSVCAVLNQRGAWASPNPHNTEQFPVLQIEVFSDPTRDANLNPEDDYTPEEKANEAFQAIDRVLHRPDGFDENWGDGMGVVRVTGSLRSGEPDISDVPEGDGLVRLLVRYDMKVAG
jgi:hypothetical protein